MLSTFLQKAQNITKFECNCERLRCDVGNSVNECYGMSLDVFEHEVVPFGGKKDTSSPLFRPHDGDSLAARFKILQLYII